MDFIDKDGIIHKGYPPQQAERRGWTAVDGDKAVVKEDVKVKSKKKQEEE